jgi:phosphoribosyl 1,2-cyclic phosphodiesterase
MILTPLASGSSGNSFLVRENGNAVLVDAGLSGKRLRERLEKVSCDPGSIDAILVSHGHSDHVKGVGVLSRKHNIPVWMNQGTWNVAGRYIGEVHELRLFKTGRAFSVAGLKVHPFSVPHDCADPVGFRISKGSAALGIATDLGVATGLVASLLTGLQVLVLESNHDPAMLQKGPYPWDLKQRVRSRLGHLSNPDSAKLLRNLISDELKAVILAHLSDTNNQPELALKCAQEPLAELLAHGGTLCCADQDRVGPSVEW